MNIDLINQTIKNQGIRKTVLSRNLGIKYSTLISILAKKKKTIDYKIIIRLSKTLKIPLKKIIGE